MIANHEFNSRWWGAPTGIVRDPAFFSLPAGERDAALTVYEWAEFRVPGPSSPDLRRSLAGAGFVFSDLEIPFEIDLGRLPGLDEESGEPARVIPAAGAPLEAGLVEPFSSERYGRLPGATDGRVTARYLSWARDLIETHPDSCLFLTKGTAVQGYFLSAPSEDGLHLALAGKFRGATVQGRVLYHRALLAYRQAGHRSGRASFSAFNTAVLNIYSRLGARLSPPVEHYLWWPRRRDSASSAAAEAASPSVPGSGTLVVPAGKPVSS
jgi:hypothetical protein